MVTSNWRTKLSEYALDSYLKLTRGGWGEAGGINLLPSKQHSATSALFLSPEKCSGHMQGTLQPQRQPVTTGPIAPRHGWAGELRRRVQSSRATERTPPPITPSDTQPDEAETRSAKWLGEQRADVWAFGCLLTSLAQHQKRANERSSQASSGCGRRNLDDMYGWDEYTSVSKDRPGRCSRLRPATEVEAAEDRPRPRTPGTELKFKALGEVASYLKRSRLYPGASSFGHGEPSTDVPEADAPLPSAPPSPPTSPVQGAESDLTPEIPNRTLPGQRRLPQPANFRKAAKAPRPPPTPYVLMLRLCQDKASPLDGVTPSCCPRPLLQLATQCCARDPEERPSIAAVLEQLHGKVLRSIDEAAYSAGVGARRPLTALEGWCEAAERTFLGTEPAAPEVRACAQEIAD